MANSTLTGFVKEALEKGEARDGIRTALLDAGWRAEEVDEALNAFSDVAFPIAVPKPQASPGDHCGSCRPARSSESRTSAKARTTRSKESM